VSFVERACAAVAAQPETSRRRTGSGGENDRPRATASRRASPPALRRRSPQRRRLARSVRRDGDQLDGAVGAVRTRSSGRIRCATRSSSSAPTTAANASRTVAAPRLEGGPLLYEGGNHACRAMACALGRARYRPPASSSDRADPSNRRLARGRAARDRRRGAVPAYPLDGDVAQRTVPVLRGNRAGCRATSSWRMRRQAQPSVAADWKYSL
jgi:hypothetical protein